MLRAFLTLGVLSLTAFPALADSTQGSVLAFDRVDKILVLADKTVWDLGLLTGNMPDSLKAGDDVVIDFISDGDNGVKSINTITLAAK